MLVRFLEDFERFHPLPSLKSVDRPVLIVAARNDGLISIESARKASQIGPHVTLVEFDCRHFDVYCGEFFEQNVTAQVEFIRNVSG